MTASPTKTQRARSGDRAEPTIGIIAALTDYAVLSQALAGDGRTVMLDERSAVPAVRDDTIDLLIIAPRHDWWSERAALVDLETAARRSQVTVLAMVPLDDEVALAETLASGVDDFTAYPFQIHIVVIRVRALLRRKHVADERRDAAAKVRLLALTDPVTGLWNRHHLDTELVAKIAIAQAAARPLSLLMIDIDRFKPINDRHGHAVGDRVLRAVASRLAAGIRGTDTLARFGGDELALIMPETALDVAGVVAERLRSLVADAPQLPDLPFGVTISIGVAELGFDEPAAALLAKADKALYAAKLDGRNRVAAAS